MNSPIAVAGYLALFVGLGFLFLFGNLLLGWLLRPKLPNQEKLEVYECGEPTIGSSFVQFDLRFYVVALLFIIFDVEVAFFFPWATVYGKATHLMDTKLPKVQASAAGPELSPAANDLYRELGVVRPTLPLATGDMDASAAVEKTAGQLAMLSLFDIGVFFAVLLVGFAYVWRRGDLDWVRAISRDRAQPAGPRESKSEMALSA
jgi:NADH-quinone oxidoreductase subunit A